MNDYFVAVGLTFVGQNDFPTKRFFWCSSSTSWVFAELPKPMESLGKCLFERIQSFFTGEFDRILVDSNGKIGSDDYELGDDVSVDPSAL